MKFFYSYSLFWRFARCRYMVYRIFLRFTIGKKRRDELLREKRISEFDFLPERTYLMDSGVKAIPRRGTRDFKCSCTKGTWSENAFTMQANETFVDVGANVGAYSLDIASQYRDLNVKVIAIEAHLENYRALCRNIQCNNFEKLLNQLIRSFLTIKE